MQYFQGKSVYNGSRSKTCERSRGGFEKTAWQTV